MPRVPPSDRPATYQDLEQLPPNMVAEIVHDEMWASPRPAPCHSRAWAQLTGRIEPFEDIEIGALWADAGDETEDASPGD